MKGAFVGGVNPGIVLGGFSSGRFACISTNGGGSTDAGVGASPMRVLSPWRFSCWRYAAIEVSSLVFRREGAATGAVCSDIANGG